MSDIGFITVQNILYEYTNFCTRIYNIMILQIKEKDQKENQELVVNLSQVVFR